MVVDHDALDSQPRSLKGSDPYGYVLICYIQMESWPRKGSRRQISLEKT